MRLSRAFSTVATNTIPPTLRRIQNDWHHVVAKPESTRSTTRWPLPQAFRICGLYLHLISQLHQFPRHYAKAQHNCCYQEGSFRGQLKTSDNEVAKALKTGWKPDRRCHLDNRVSLTQNGAYPRKMPMFNAQTARLSSKHVEMKNLQKIFAVLDIPCLICVLIEKLKTSTASSLRLSQILPVENSATGYRGKQPAKTTPMRDLPIAVSRLQTTHNSFKS